MRPHPVNISTIGIKCGSHYLSCLFAGVLACLLPAVAAYAAPGVSGGIVFVVSPNGSDTHAGTADKPFATLQRARDAIRRLPEKNARILIRGGTYYLPRGITFGPEDSGTQQHRITYAAYPNEVPILIGGAKITGWKQFNSSIYVADLPKGISGSQLFEGSKRLTAARAPQTGYFRLARGLDTNDHLAFEFDPTDFDPTDWDISEAKVNIWPNHDWFNHNYSIKSIDSNKHTISLQAGRTTLRPGNRFYIKNVLALLDQPGEFFISLKTRKIYVWPKSGVAGLEHMVLSTADSVVRIKGDGDKTVQNLDFHRLDIGICEGDAVSISRAEDCSIRNCKIENAGVTGVMISGHAQRIVLEGNLIRRHGQHGVSLMGRGPGRSDISHHNIVTNNHIHHCGRLIGHGYGVRISQSGHNQITHNHIHHVPRYGVTIKGARYGTIKGKIPGMTWENRYDFMPGRNNLIAYNDIHHTNLDSQDTGAIESWGSGRDNIIKNNLIHDTGNNEFNLQSGIYLDDQADYFTVTSNIIYGVVGTNNNQCIYTKGIGNLIENNILVGNNVCGTGIRSFSMADERCDHHTYLRNIIFFEPDGPAVKRGAFGSGVSNIHDKGTTLKWRIDIPAGGTYHLWMRYAAHNTPYGVTKMDGRTSVSIDSGEPTALRNMPDTGGWGRQQWARTATIPITEGPHTVLWKNEKGSGLNMDALLLCTDDDWAPRGVTLPPLEPGHQLVLIQAENYMAKNGRSVESNARAYAFVNWSDDRVTESDNNVFFNSGGSVTIQGGPADKSYEKWRQILSSRFDQSSVVSDPMFVDVPGRDFRLKSNSPALGLGFKPIDTSRIGLTDKFPPRFERQ